ncbi:anthranilate synthase component I [Helicobacter pylori]|nr:anthranilate synthase component I [Helicobacter pylori]
MRVLWWVLQKSGLDIDDKKAFEIESEATKPPLMVKSCLKLIYNHNIVTTASLTLNGGAFL